jgi:hypothetical protein
MYNINVKKATTSPCAALKCTWPARFALSSSIGGPLRFGSCALFTSLLRAAVISAAGVKISLDSIAKDQSLLQKKKKYKKGLQGVEGAMGESSGPSRVDGW